jgi:cysteine synthase
MPAGLAYLLVLAIFCGISIGISIGIALIAARWLDRRDHDPPH